ncbi:Thioredoxin M-type, chloroplastic [Apostasia shenzhenica]|uniref:Thioredoxin M-type, chloroplastic n=1 Tax=Apostasia shenzhenica TaxID=1088818 RepID=A0A2I0AI22_9ASPA|nr:Thioredoxin M-type, chloroplastic [Apostasia shenzhenica]
MAMEDSFRLSSASPKRSLFHLHYFPLPMKKQPANPKNSPSPVSPLHVASARDRSRRTQLFICRAKNIVDAVVEVTDDTWKELVLESGTLVLVKFWAPSCGPCKVVEAVMVDIAREFAGKVACYKINTDDCLKMASQYGVRSIPTIIFFKDGKQKECITGAFRKSSLYTTLDKYL